MKRILVVSDLSCVGRCSLTAAIPVLAAGGVEVVPLPTAVLSTQTGGIEGFTCDDLTSLHEKILAHWEALGLQFDAILTGYLTSTQQVETVRRALKLLKPSAKLYVDPVMGDGGSLYPGYNRSLVPSVIYLAGLADVTFPNFTEACIVSGKESASVAEVLAAYPDNGKPAVVTGIEDGNKLLVGVREKGEWSFIEARRRKGFFHGAGDVYTAAYVACELNGMSVKNAAETALQFVERAMDRTESEGADTRFGLCFEPELGWLSKACAISD